MDHHTITTDRHTQAYTQLRHKGNTSQGFTIEPSYTQLQCYRRRGSHKERRGTHNENRDEALVRQGYKAFTVKTLSSLSLSLALTLSLLFWPSISVCIATLPPPPYIWGRQHRIGCGQSEAGVDTPANQEASRPALRHLYMFHSPSLSPDSNFYPLPSVVRYHGCDRRFFFKGECSGAVCNNKLMKDMNIHTQFDR